MRVKKRSKYEEDLAAGYVIYAALCGGEEKE